MSAIAAVVGLLVGLVSSIAGAEATFRSSQIVSDYEAEVCPTVCSEGIFILNPAKHEDVLVALSFRGAFQDAVEAFGNIECHFAAGQQIKPLGVVLDLGFPRRIILRTYPCKGLTPYIESWSLAAVGNCERRNKAILITNARCSDPDVGPQLTLRRSLGYVDHLKSGLVGQDGNYECGQHQPRTYTNDPGLSLRRVSHTLRRFVHSSLSREVVYLPLAGILFNALSGIFLGLFLHYLNWQWKWWPLFLSGGFACLGFWLMGVGLSLRA
ncbi:MAG: hypothetical protein LPK90_01140 [Alphaproteobacteria bacterium]|nr:hypothetical protein [Alphaproteobacteria bacterium]MDX5492098.1 hypothetical protein [Alphaproteobacteria bacterium]